MINIKEKDNGELFFETFEDITITRGIQTVKKLILPNTSCRIAPL